jgi:hypothetical protein
LFCITKIDDKENNQSDQFVILLVDETLNFKEKPLFKADAGAEKAPEVFTE